MTQPFIFSYKPNNQLNIICFDVLKCIFLDVQGYLCEVLVFVDSLFNGLKNRKEVSGFILSSLLSRENVSIVGSYSVVFFPENYWIHFICFDVAGVHVYDWFAGLPLQKWLLLIYFLRVGQYKGCLKWGFWGVDNTLTIKYIQRVNKGLYGRRRLNVWTLWCFLMVWLK